jgi:hypothetical protein
LREQRRETPAETHRRYLRLRRFAFARFFAP